MKYCNNYREGFTRRILTTLGWWFVVSLFVTILLTSFVDVEDVPEPVQKENTMKKSKLELDLSQVWQDEPDLFLWAVGQLEGGPVDNPYCVQPDTAREGAIAAGMNLDRVDLTNRHHVIAIYYHYGVKNGVENTEQMFRVYRKGKRGQNWETAREYAERGMNLIWDVKRKGTINVKVDS